MNKGEDLVRHIGKLSRIELTDEEIHRFSGQLKDIISYFDTLQRLDTDNVDPLVHPVELSNVFAEDTARESLPREQVLANAPKTDGKFFKVPKILGD
ncbi:MAG: Asp-tRNA(Asn)/Glu-tRNA(Gln) amidotransferase subunit GatC [bacterium]